MMPVAATPVPVAKSRPKASMVSCGSAMGISEGASGASGVCSGDSHTCERRSKVPRSSGAGTVADYHPPEKFRVPAEYILCSEAGPVLQSLALFRGKDRAARGKAYKDFLYMYGPRRMPQLPGPAICKSIGAMSQWFFDVETESEESDLE